MTKAISKTEDELRKELEKLKEEHDVLKSMYEKDIQERKHIEDSLHKSESRLRQAERASKTGNWELCLDTKIMIASEGAETIYGLHGKRFDYEAVKHIPLQEYRPLLNDALNNLIEFSHPYNLEFKIKNDETGKIIDIHSVANYNKDKRIIFGVIQDITERKIAEAVIYKREEEFRSTFEQAGVGMAHVGSDGKWIRVNNRLCEMLGYSKEELLSKTFQDITFSADLFIDTNNLFQLVNNEIQSFSREKRYIRKDGTLIWASLTSSALRDTSGKIEYIISVIKDISDRKEIELNLLKSEEKFAQAFRMSPDAISIVSMEDARYIDINNVFCDTIGYRREEVVGHSAMELNVWVNLNDRKNYLEALSTKGILKAFETQYRMRSGEIRDFIVTGETFELEGEKCSLNFSLDITERKRAEEALIKSDEKFRALFEGSNDALMTLKPPEWKFSSCNKSTLEMFKVSTVEQFIEYGPSEFSPERQPDESISNEKSMMMIELAMSNGSHHFEWTHRRLDGAEFPATVLLTKIELKDSIFLQATVRDITAQKQAEAELEKHRNHLEELVKLRTEEWEDANEELKIQLEKQKEYEMMLQQSLEKELELNEMKSRFISTASHEFKTPLTSILTSAGMIQRYVDRWTPEKRNEHLNRIQRSVTNLSQLVDDVLTISKTEDGNINFNPEWIDMHKHASECLEEVKSLTASNHKLTFDYKSEQKQFELDPKLMKFILNNLLSNAIKYSPDGGRVELLIEANQKYLKIKVRDEGIGIPPEDTEKIFDSFYRTKNAEEIKGTGLGLAIIKRAVELHSGEVNVSSELNIGTTFTVKIPLSKTFFPR